jgi:hypothetical protein
MSRIIAAFNVYNEVTILRAALESVLPYVEKIIIVDGAYAKFTSTGNNGASNDGTLELVRKLQEEWNGRQIQLIEAPGRPWESEMEKRTAYFDAADDGDWLFILDADERLAFGGDYIQQLRGIDELRPFNSGVTIFRFITEKGTHSYGTVTRVYKKLPGTHYGNTHAHVLHAGGCRWSELYLPVVIEHPMAIRPPAREKEKWDYYASGNMK